MSRRLVRSPPAPKITMTQGGAGGASAAPGLAHQGWIVVSAAALPLRACSFMGRIRDLGFEMAAEAFAHGREQLVRETRIQARAEARIERGREHGRRYGLLDGGLNGPAA